MSEADLAAADAVAKRFGVRFSKPGLQGASGAEEAVAAAVRVGRISEPPQGPGIYAACLERASGEWGAQWQRGDFYVGLASDLEARLGYMHGRWDQIRDARAVFVTIEKGGPLLRDVLEQCEGAVERKLSAFVHTVNAAETMREWSPEIEAIAEEAVRACLALRAEVLG